MPGSTKKVLRIFSNDNGWFIGTPYNGWHMKFTDDPVLDDTLRATSGKPAFVTFAVRSFSQAMKMGEPAVLEAVSDAAVLEVPIPAAEAVAVVDAMFVQNEIMEVEEEIVATCTESIMNSLREVGGAVVDFLAGLIGAEEAKVKEDGGDDANDEPIHVEGNNSAFTIKVDNRTSAKTFDLKEVHVQEKVMIQTSTMPGPHLGLMGSQTLSYGYSSWTKAGNKESSCWVKWELADKSWWFGIQIHVPAKGIDMGTWPYYQVSSANNDGHNGDWWRPDAKASSPSEITPDKFADKEKFQVAILPTSSGSTLELDVTVREL